MIPQTWATTLSLVLVTGFRAALVASISLSYAQYLWKNLRSRVLKVELIEELFQIRSNPLRLLNHALLRYTPTLLAFAIFTWLVPVAMVFPSGTLVVTSESLLFHEEFNVSVLQPAYIPPPQQFDPEPNEVVVKSLGEVRYIYEPSTNRTKIACE
jgi:hypothetical protein